MKLQHFKEEENLIQELISLLSQWRLFVYEDVDNFSNVLQEIKDLIEIKFKEIFEKFSRYLARDFLSDHRNDIFADIDIRNLTTTEKLSIEKYIRKIMNEKGFYERFLIHYDLKELSVEIKKDIFSNVVQHSLVKYSEMKKLIDLEEELSQMKKKFNGNSKLFLKFSLIFLIVFLII